MAENAKAEEAKNIDLKFITDHVHVDSKGKRHEYKVGEVGHFTEADADAIRKTSSAVLNVQPEKIEAAQEATKVSAGATGSAQQK